MATAAALEPAWLAMAWRLRINTLGRLRLAIATWSCLTDAERRSTTRLHRLDWFFVLVGLMTGWSLVSGFFEVGRAAPGWHVVCLIALAGALLRKSVRGGLIVVGEVTVGGVIEPIHNAVTLAEIAVEKGAKALLLPVSCRRQLFDLSDDMATQLDIQFYQDTRDALLKALTE